MAQRRAAPKHHAEPRVRRMTEREKNFPALLERLRPECERIIAQYEQKRSALLPMMHLFQEHEGYVSADAMNAAAAMLNLTNAEVEATVSFYTLLYRRPVGKYMLQVCRGLACSINGAEDIMAYFREKLGIGHLQTTDDGVFSYEEVECLAACDKASCMQVNLDFVYSLTPQIDRRNARSYAIRDVFDAADGADRGSGANVGDLARERYCGRQEVGWRGRRPAAEQCRRRRRSERHHHARSHHQSRRRVLHQDFRAGGRGFSRGGRSRSRRKQPCRSLRS